MDLKTTLATLALQRLRQSYSGERDAIAAVFIRDDVRWGEASFIEDFLLCIFRQLREGIRSPLESDSVALRQYDKYLEARQLGQRNAARIKAIREALDLLIASLDNAFLIMDGFDRCSPAVDLFLEDEFPRMRRAGLRIMTTSRIPCLLEPFEVYACDGLQCPMPRRRRVYWECQKCKLDDVSMDLCHVCIETQPVCRRW